jgi:hypothetical protein
MPYKTKYMGKRRQSSSNSICLSFHLVLTDRMSSLFILTLMKAATRHSQSNQHISRLTWGHTSILRVQLFSLFFFFHSTMSFILIYRHACACFSTKIIVDRYASFVLFKSSWMSIGIRSSHYICLHLSTQDTMSSVNHRTRDLHRSNRRRLLAVLIMSLVSVWYNHLRRMSLSGSSSFVRHDQTTHTDKRKNKNKQSRTTTTTKENWHNYEPILVILVATTVFL